MHEAAGVGTAWGSVMQDSMKASKESSSRLCPLGDISLPAARWGLSGVVSQAPNFARVSGGPLWWRLPRRACFGVMHQVCQGGGVRATCELCPMG